VEPARPERPRANHHTSDAESSPLGDDIAKTINARGPMKDLG